MRRSNVRRFFILTVTFFITVCFQNCGQEVTFDDGFQKGNFAQTNSPAESMEIDSLDVSDIIDLVAVNDGNQELELGGEAPPVIEVTDEDNDSDSGQQDSEDHRSEDSTDQTADINPPQEGPSSSNNQGQQVAEENKQNHASPSNNNDETDDTQADSPSPNDYGLQVSEENMNKDPNPSTDETSDSSQPDQSQASNNANDSGNDDDIDDQGDEEKDAETSDLITENEDVPTNDPETYMYRCVLRGKGKSRHIGVIEEQIVADKDTPNTLCMSKNTCLNIMPNLGFDVQGPQYRGYCKNEKAHTRTITDSQAFALIAE